MLKTVVESLDGLDEAVANLYAEADGKFVLQIEGVDAHPDVLNLKNAYDRTKADRDAARAEREEWKAKAGAVPEDFDPEKWKKLKDGKPDEAALVQLRKELEADRDEWKGKHDTLVEARQKDAIASQIGDALSAAGVTRPSLLQGARAVLGGKVQVSEEGNPFFETDIGPMTAADYIRRWAASDEGKDFVTGAAGGGAPGNTGDKTTPRKTWAEAKTPQEKVAALQAKRE